MEFCYLKFLCNDYKDGETMKTKNGFKDEEEFRKATGMTPIEFTRFIRQKAAKEVDAEIKKLKRRKKFY